MYRCVSTDSSLGCSVIYLSVEKVPVTFIEKNSALQKDVSMLLWMASHIVLLDKKHSWRMFFLLSLWFVFTMILLDANIFSDNVEQVSIKCGVY